MNANVRIRGSYVAFLVTTFNKSDRWVLVCMRSLMECSVVVHEDQVLCALDHKGPARRREWRISRRLTTVGCLKNRPCQRALMSKDEDGLAWRFGSIKTWNWMRLEQVKKDPLNGKQARGLLVRTINGSILINCQTSRFQGQILPDMSLQC